MKEQILKKKTKCSVSSNLIYYNIRYSNNAVGTGTGNILYLKHRQKEDMTSISMYIKFWIITYHCMDVLYIHRSVGKHVH